MEELVCESTLCGKPWKVHRLPALGESLATTLEQEVRARQLAESRVTAPSFMSSLVTLSQEVCTGTRTDLTVVDPDNHLWPSPL